MDKIIADAKAMFTDIRAYVVAALIAWLSMAYIQANDAIDAIQEKVDTVVAEVQAP